MGNVRKCLYLYPVFENKLKKKKKKKKTPNSNEIKNNEYI